MTTLRKYIFLIVLSSNCVLKFCLLKILGKKLEIEHVGHYSLGTLLKESISLGFDISRILLIIFNDKIGLRP